MFYINIIITFSLFSELLWKSTLLVRYKLNRFLFTRVSKFDIHALLFGGYYRFIPLDKMVFIENINLPSVSSSMSQIYLTLFLFCNGFSLQSFQLSSWDNYNSVRRQACFYYCLSGLNNIIFLTLRYQRKYLNNLSCDVSL